MSNYKYKNLINEGYMKIKLSPSEHKRIFKNYNRKYKYEVYENNNSYIRQRFYPLWIVILNTILYPISILVYGISNIKEINSEIYELIHQKKTGKFYKEIVYKSTLKNRELGEKLQKS